MRREDSRLDDVVEEYNKLHSIPHDVTDRINHTEFVEGAKKGSVGFKMKRGEAISLVHGARKALFNIIVIFYLLAPAIVIPVWAYRERSWWLLLGIPVASLIAPRLAHGRGNLIGGGLLFAFLGLWFSVGLRSYYTFFSLCTLWGYIFFQIAENVQTEYAMQSLIDSPEIFAKAITEKRIVVLRRRDS